ncbi:MAG: hypothetical protein NZ529_11065 [Cytophagaceae bacterium]|nr:hypothetical protein [Cytophagaceae bacterium]MDW8457324.1 hypothetical protein [Cytophagaceae bacterium]
MSAQEINFDHLASPSGKHWYIVVNPDNNTLKEYEKDDYLVFYSDGRCEYHDGRIKAPARNTAMQQSTNNPALRNSSPKPKGWIYDKNTRAITFNFKMDDGSIQQIRGEVYSLDEEYFTINIERDGENLVRSFTTVRTQ